LKGKRSCFCSDTEFQVALSQVKSKYWYVATCTASHNLQSFINLELDETAVNIFFAF
jgi:glutaredoxin-related protein